MNFRRCVRRKRYFLLHHFQIFIERKLTQTCDILEVFLIPFNDNIMEFHVHNIMEYHEQNESMTHDFIYVRSKSPWKRTFNSQTVTAIARCVANYWLPLLCLARVRRCSSSVVKMCW